MLDALTDLTDRRLAIRNRTLDPRRYEVRERGETWAVAREATAGPPFGSRLEVQWDNTGARWWARLLLGGMHRGPLGRLIARQWAAALDRHARAGRAPSAGPPPSAR